MKMEIRIEGKVIVIEAEGAVSVRVTDGGGAVVEAQDVAPGAAPEDAQGAACGGWDSGPVWEPAILYGDAPWGSAGDVPEGTAVDAPEGGGGAAPMKGEAEAGEAPGPASADDLFLELSCLRREIASEASVPPYVVFKDSTLHAMAKVRPADLAGLSGISGVGPVKLEKYGERFLAVIKGVAA